MIYEIEDLRFRRFLSVWLQDKVKAHKRRLSLTAMLQMRARFEHLRYRYTWNFLKQWIAAGGFNAKPRFKQNGRRIKPKAKSPRHYCAELIAQSVTLRVRRAAQVYFDHLYVDVLEWVWRDVMNASEAAAWVLYDFWQQRGIDGLQFIHWKAIAMFYKCARKSWYFRSWMRYCFFCPSQRKHKLDNELDHLDAEHLGIGLES